MRIETITRGMKKMKFSTKLTLLFSIIVFMIVAAISYIVYVSNISTLEHHIKDRLQNQAFHSMDKIDRMLFERYGDIKTLASDPVISSGKATPAQITERLKSYKENYKYYASLSFFDLNRVRLADTAGLDIGKQHALSTYWLELAQGKEIVTDIFERTMHFAQVVKDKNNTPFGVVVSRIYIEKLKEIVNQRAGVYNVDRDFHVELLDKEGFILYSNKKMEGILREKSVDWDIVEKQKAAGVVTGVIQYTNPKEKIGEEVLVVTGEQGFEDFKGNGWTLLLEAPTRIVFGSVFELQKKIIAASILIWLLAFFIIYRFSLRLSRPINEMSKASEEITGGNLEVRVETSSNGEIGQLAVSFNRMTEALKIYRDEALEYRMDLEATYSELKKIFGAVEQAAEGIVITDIDGAMEYANPAFSEVTGYRAEDVYGMDSRMLNSGMNPPELFEDLWKTILSGKKWTGILINKKKTGELYHEELAINPVTDKEGKITNFIAIKSDVSERFEAEEKLKSKNIELEDARLAAEAANRAKSEFLANMSHELRTPLNHIIGFSEMMREGMAGPLTDKQKEYSGDIADSGNRLLSVLNEILDLSRIDAGETGLELSEFDLRNMLDSSLAFFKEKALKHNIKTSLDIADGLSIITADQKKIKQVVVSLLGNALKFSPDGGSVSVWARKGFGFLGSVVSKEEPIPASARLKPLLSATVGSPQTPIPDRDFVEISVADTGNGISAENRKRLFSPFEQLESPYTKTHEGIGLGLFLSKKLVEMHGGRIWEGGEEGKGSKFIFTLPGAY